VISVSGRENKENKEEMMAKTRIGTHGLTGEAGSTSDFPDEIELCCPQCGTLAADKGQCVVEFVPVPAKEESKTGFLLGMTVDCRSCGCFGKPPAIKF